MSRDRPRSLTNSGDPGSAGCVGGLLLLFDASSEAFLVSWSWESYGSCRDGAHAYSGRLSPPLCLVLLYLSMWIAGGCNASRSTLLNRAGTLRTGAFDCSSVFG